MAGYAEKGHRCTASRRLLTIILVTAVVVSVSGCGGDDDDDDDDTTTTTEIDSADLEAALAEFQEDLESTPEAIADDMRLLGLTQVTPEQVASLAVDLCVSGFDPRVVTEWLQNQATTTSIFMVEPANRLLDYSGTSAVCSRGPTPDEQANYESAVLELIFPGPQASVPPPPMAPDGLPHVPRELATAVCEVLNTSAGGAAAQSGLESLVTRVSQGRIDPRTFIPTTVWIAGAACKHLLPDAAEAIYQFFTSQRTSGTTSP